MLVTVGNEESGYMLVEEVAQHARAPISTVRHWISSGRLKAYKPGRRVLVKAEDLEEFLAASAV